MAITIKSGRCWRIVLSDGTDYNDDGVPHYDTEADAKEAITGEGLPAEATAQQFPKPCVTVTCDECGTDSGAADRFSELHFPSLTEAQNVAAQSDWKLTPKGDFCWDCPAPAADDEEDV